jgi:hypothetical protein
MHCEACQNKLEWGAPVYRVALHYGHSWVGKKCPGVIVRVCAACNSGPPLFYPDTRFPDRRIWWPPSPCQHCGRPIIASRKRRLPKLFCCSAECEAAARNARRERRYSERRCKGCDKPFQPTRIKATFCSPTCKQRVYRRRNAAAGNGIFSCRDRQLKTGLRDRRSL